MSRKIFRFADLVNVPKELYKQPEVEAREREGALGVLLPTTSANAKQAKLET